MSDADRRLDGNAIAGLLQEIFAFEMTTAGTICASCGAEHPVGALLVYTHAMGSIVRCLGCENVMLRIAVLPGRYALDMSGVRQLVIAQRS